MECRLIIIQERDGHEEEGIAYLMHLYDGYGDSEGSVVEVALAMRLFLQVFKKSASESSSSACAKW